MDLLAQIFHFLKNAMGVPKMDLSNLGDGDRRFLLHRIYDSRFGHPAACSISAFTLDSNFLKPIFSRYQEHVEHLLAPRICSGHNRLREILSDFKEYLDPSKGNPENAGQAENLTLVIEAISAGHRAGGFAKIVVNDGKIDIEENESRRLRGLHVAVIRPSDGQVVSAKAFDTSASSTGLEDFISNAEIPEGYIIAAACMDDCASNLSETAKVWFANMGSTEILKLEPRQPYAFIGVSGRRDLREKRAGPEDQVYVA